MNDLQFIWKSFHSTNTEDTIFFQVYMDYMKKEKLLCNRSQIK